MNDPIWPTTSRSLAFNNGLSAAEDNRIDELMIEVGRLVSDVEDLGRHRSYSLAITHLDEARHWLRDRKHRTA